MAIKSFNQNANYLILLLFLCDFKTIYAVTFPKTSNLESGRGNYGINDEDIGVCLRSDDPLVPCLTSSIVQGIESAGYANTLVIGEDMRLMEDPKHDKRTLTGDPREARTLIEAITMYMEPRFLLWDLSDFYPGLIMRVGPSARAYLQFFLDKRKVIDDRSLSTGRLLMKRTVLPVLLGIKLNVASLAPILIAGFILLLKKLFLMSKLSFIIAAISLFLNYRQHSHGSFGSSAGSFGSSAGSFAGNGLGSFGGPKKIIIERPVNHWFAKEEADPLQPLE